MLFAGGRTRFVFVPWGGYVPPAAAILANAPAPARHDGPEIVSAGKSGRDYPTLAEAALVSGCHLVVICNEKAALADVPQSPGIEVLSDCFDMDYLGRLLRADIVAVPLRVEDISAGQMVLIQAMALARPLIATDTPTIRDYLEDGVTALLVPRGDAAAMAGAIRRLLGDSQQARSLGERARQRYEAEFSVSAHLRALVGRIEDHASHTDGRRAAS